MTAPKPTAAAWAADDEDPDPEAQIAGIVDGAEEPTETDEKAFARLAALSPVAYDRCRVAEAERLGIRVSTLHAEVARLRPDAGDDEAGGGAVTFDDPDPEAHPVDGAELLDTLVATCRRYLSLSDHQGEAIALWTLFSHLHDAFMTSPLLAITSPTKGCGKSTVLSVLQPLVPKALPAANITAAALFRSIEKWSPSLLIDEADSFLRDNEDLRGVLNSGHNRAGAYVIRTVGDDHEPRRFQTWSPKSVALIGRLPGTLADRSIHIEMRRKGPAEAVERFRSDRVEHLRVLHAKAARWAADHFITIKSADPEMPAALFNRAADNWRPLLAIADAAGEDWPERARRAALALTDGKAAEADDTRGQLLADIHTIFEHLRLTRIPSDRLANELGKLEGRPWPDFVTGKPITATKVARLLKAYNIAPRKIRFSVEGPQQGYERSDFDDAFIRYLTPSQSGTPEQIGDINGLADFQTGTRPGDVPLSNGDKPLETNECSGVPLSDPQKPGSGGNGRDGGGTQHDDWPPAWHRTAPADPFELTDDWPE